MRTQSGGNRLKKLISAFLAIIMLAGLMAYLPGGFITVSAAQKGDADGDGQITVADALAALRVAAKLAPATQSIIAICDIDGDGVVTVADALAILRVAAKLAPPFGEKSLTSISVTTKPTKTSYVQCETLDVTGGKITAYYNDGSSEVVNMTASMVSGFNSSTTGTKTLTVTYEGKTATFTVTVVEQSSTSVIVTWINYDGAVLEAVSVEKGVLPSYSGAVPIKANDASYTYTFEGWSPRIEKAARNATYVAQYSQSERELFTITYDSNGGTGAPASQTKIKGKTLTLSSLEPSNGNHLFVGWACGNDGRTYHAGSSFSVDSDVILCAVWGHACDSCVGSGSVLSTCSVCNGTGKETVPAHNETCSSCGGSGKSSTEKGCDSCGGTGKGIVRCTACPNSWFYWPACTQTCPACSHVGRVDSCKTCNGTGKYKLDCQYCNGRGEITVQASTITCTNCNGTKKESVVCDICLGNGRVCDNEPEYTIRLYDSILLREEKVLKNRPYILNTPSKNGYTFLGWYDTFGTQYTDELGVSLSTYKESKNKDLYAHWQLNYYSITYDCEENVDLTGLPTVYTVQDGRVNLPAHNSDNYKLVWKVNEIVSSDINTSIAKDTVVEGIWFPKDYGDIVSFGKCGDNLKWALCEGGNLRISGTGNMFDYSNTNNTCPWGTGIKSVTIQDGATSIGSSAFSGCAGLTSVTIPDSVTSIGNYAFESCSGVRNLITGTAGLGIARSFKYSLTDVVIVDGVTSIGNSAFEGCTGLRSVTIPDSVTSIDSSAFSGCTGVRNLITGTAGLGIARSFYNSLTDVVILGSVTSIGNYAFKDCTKLTSVTIGNGVTSIGEYAFSHCDGLTSVTIPDSVTSISDRAFSFCTGLTSVTIGSGVTSIGEYAFSYCAGLTSVTIGNGVTSIGEYAFLSCTGLTSVTIPNSVTSIDKGAFQECTGLTSVTIPDSVTSIGSGAFYGCTGLTNVTMGNSVTSIGIGAFSGCTGLTSVTIPASVTRIGDRAFKDCNIVTLYVCNNSYAHRYAVNNGIAYAVIAKSLTSIAVTTEPTKTSYIVGETLDVTGGKITAYYSDGSSEVVNMTAAMVSGFDSSTTGTKTLAVTYENKTATFTVTVVAKSITSIAVTTEPTKTSYIVGETLDVTGGKITAYYNDGSSSVVNMTASMVSGFNSSTTGTKTLTVTYNGKTATFTVTVVAKTLTSISVTTKPTKTTYTQGETLDVTGGKITAYYNDGSSSVVNMTASMVSGFNSSTAGTKTLTVTYNGKTATFCVEVIAASGVANGKCGENLYWTLDEDGNLTISGSGDMDEYMVVIDGVEWEFIKKAPWADYEVKSVVIEYGVTSIGGGAFSEFMNCTNLTSITIPDSVTRIGDIAFNSCTKLTAITMPSSITSIGYAVFAGCLGLNDVVISDGLTSISDYAFASCTSLTSLTIPDGVTSIGDYAFDGCTKLTSVTIGNGVTSIGEGAFEDCNKVTLYVSNNSYAYRYAVNNGIKYAII